MIPAHVYSWIGIWFGASVCCCLVFCAVARGLDVLEEARQSPAEKDPDPSLSWPRTSQRGAQLRPFSTPAAKGFYREQDRRRI